MEQLSIYEQLSFCTARIETEDTSGNTYSGTGFFFSLKVKDKNVPLLVTNKHVVRGMKKGVSYLLLLMLMEILTMLIILHLM